MVYFFQQASKRLSYFAIILPLDFSETFNTFRIIYFASFREFREEEFPRKTSKLSQLTNFLTKNEMVFRKAMLYKMRSNFKKYSKFPKSPTVELLIWSVSFFKAIQLEELAHKILDPPFFADVKIWNL